MEEAEADLRTAVHLARAFDADPVYTQENMIFVEHIPNTFSAYDDAGPTAVDALRSILDECGDLVPEAFRRKLETEIG